MWAGYCGVHMPLSSAAHRHTAHGTRLMALKMRPEVSALAPLAARNCGRQHRLGARALSVRVEAARKNQDQSPYRTTVKLPETSFGLRANAPTTEPAIQSFWKENEIYEKLFEEASGEPWTLHDGPPYANGDLHIGHALNKILKDFINRHKILQGRRVRYVPGWDTHGLPIELKVLQSMTDEQRAALTTGKLRAKARAFALKTVDRQRAQFLRYGIWGNWESPYVTLDPKFEAAQLEVFGQMFLNGHIYRGRKPVHWSPSSGTALAEAELEYPEGHTSRSIYVAMPLKGLGANVPDDLKQELEGAAFAIWTTTPWTIPANLAIAVNADLEYALVAAKGEGSQGWQHKRLVVAKDLVEELSELLGCELECVGALSGAALEGCRYRHPLFERESPVVVGGDYITTESGTGLVHTAPGHGQEDYQVGQRYGLELLSPVDDAGVFTAEAGPFAGLSVQGEGNAAVVEALREGGWLLKEEAYVHKYPYDWRTKQPTIFRATDQWFASVDGFRQAALDAIQSVTWVPAVGERRITSMTEGRSDWCISRQRKWGVPIPVFYYKESGEPLMTKETIAHVVEVIRGKGTDAWWQLEVEELLPEALRDQAPLLKRGEDTMDVWFDSGSSWAGVLQSTASLQYPADLYVEGSDQHRGWFQSSLLTSVAANGIAPYRKVLTHGFVLDENGRKMSKSLGNVVDPNEIIEGGQNKKKQPAFGADVLRLWVASVDYSSDVMIGGNLVNQIAEQYRKIRGTVRFLLGNLHDFDPKADAVSFEQLPSCDQHLLRSLAAMTAEVEDAYEEFQFYKAFQVLLRFVVVELSNFYLDVSKDRLYIRGTASPQRRCCQTVLYHLLHAMLSCIAPVLPHMAEDAWQNLPYATGQDSVFQAQLWRAPAAWGAEAAEAAALWEAKLKLREEVNALLEKARQQKLVGASLEAQVLLHVENEQLKAQLLATEQQANGVDELRYLFITSKATLVDDASSIQADFRSEVELEVAMGGKVTIGVLKAGGRKCARCWNYSDRTGSDASHPELCERCTPVVLDLGFVPEPLPAAV